MFLYNQLSTINSLINLDRNDATPMQPSSFNLTLEQQFEMQKFRSAAQQLSREQALDLLLQANKMLMVKNNILKDLQARSTLNPGCQ